MFLYKNYPRQMEIEVVLAQVLHKSYSPVLSLPHVLRSISRAEKNSHDTIYVKAVIKLAMTHYNLGLVGKGLHAKQRLHGTNFISSNFIGASLASCTCTWITLFTRRNIYYQCEMPYILVFCKGEGKETKLQSW